MYPVRLHSNSDDLHVRAYTVLLYLKVEINHLTNVNYKHCMYMYLQILWFHITTYNYRSCDVTSCVQIHAARREPVTATDTSVIVLSCADDAAAQT